MKRATAETHVNDKGEMTHFWVWKKGRRVYMEHEPGPKTEANKRRNVRRKGE